jgi:tRNA dimethylallyltransferase
VERLRSLDPTAAENVDAANRRRLERAVERGGQTPAPSRPRYETLVIGLTAPREVLYRRAEDRVDRMIERGWVEEVRALLRHYPPSLPALSGIGYGELGQYLAGELGLAAAIEGTKRRTRQLIKRQMTWFRRDEDVRWLDVSEPAWTEQARALIGTMWALPTAR